MEGPSHIEIVDMLNNHINFVIKKRLILFVPSYKSRLYNMLWILCTKFQKTPLNFVDLLRYLWAIYMRRTLILVSVKTKCKKALRGYILDNCYQHLWIWYIYILKLEKRTQFYRFSIKKISGILDSRIPPFRNSGTHTTIRLFTWNWKLCNFIL